MYVSGNSLGKGDRTLIQKILIFGVGSLSATTRSAALPWKDRGEKGIERREEGGERREGRWEKRDGKG